MRPGPPGHEGKYDPNQPRVPAGSSSGGQWTRVGGPTGSALDASVDVVNPNAELAQIGSQISFGPDALTGISGIDETTVALATTLAKVVDGIGLIPGADAARYGTAVHVMFATAVRLAGFPGIGFFDVESTFGPEPDARYGAKGSVRTDIVLRNEAREIIAIYDVKTGGARIRPGRARELRVKTGTGPSVPIIELHVVRGISLKRVVQRDSVYVYRAGARY
jgi:hypothetical protein